MPVEVKVDKVPALGLRQLFGNGRQSLEEELAVPAASRGAVSVIRAPFRKLLLEELVVQR